MRYAVTTRDPLGDHVDHGEVASLAEARDVAQALAARGERATIWGPLDSHGEGEIVESVAPRRTS